MISLWDWNSDVRKCKWMKSLSSLYIVLAFLQMSFVPLFLAGAKGIFLKLGSARPSFIKSNECRVLKLAWHVSVWVMTFKPWGTALLPVYQQGVCYTERDMSLDIALLPSWSFSSRWCRHGCSSLQFQFYISSPFFFVSTKAQHQTESKGWNPVNIQRAGWGRKSVELE